MERHHTGSGRRTVLPADWSAHHRQILVATHTATVTLRKPGGTPGTFDPDSGSTPVTPYEAYYGADATEPNARIQVLADSAQLALAGGQEISTLRYAVMLDHAVTGVELEDLCNVTAVDDNGDAELVGRDLTVESITRGSLHWERRLICTDDLETPDTSG